MKHLQNKHPDANGFQAFPANNMNKYIHNHR